MPDDTDRQNLPTTNTPVTPTSSDSIQPNSGQNRIIEYERKLNELRSNLALLESESSTLIASIEKELVGIAKLEDDIQPILKEEASLLILLKEVSTKEQSTTDIQARRTVEQERWKLMGDWYKTEQDKWKVQEKLESQKKRTEEHRQHQILLENQEKELRIQIGQLEIDEEKEKLHFELNEITANRIAIENKLREIELVREKAIAHFSAIGQKEEAIEKKESIVENMLLSAHSLAEERTYSEERYALEKERHEIESSRWVIEDDITKLGTAGVESDKLLRELVKKEEQVRNALLALETKSTQTKIDATPKVDAGLSSDKII